MPSRPFSVVLFHSPEKPAARSALPRLTSWFRKRGVKVLPPAAMASADAVVSLGGDGTLLSAARRAAPAGVPVLGVNLGRLGYLTAADVSHLDKTLAALIDGKLPASRRLMLEARAGTAPARPALNDCVVRGRDVARVVSLAVKVDGEPLGHFVGDGLIVSTPTGSTAYSLAASGPIVQPELDVLLLTPICSHSLTQRPLVLSADGVIEIMLENDGRSSEVVVSLDGQSSFSLKPGKSVTVRRAPARFQLLTDPSRTAFGVLREKLKWGER